MVPVHGVENRGLEPKTGFPTCKVALDRKNGLQSENIRKHEKMDEPIVNVIFACSLIMLDF